jgi:hypothetical protein
MKLLVITTCFSPENAIGSIRLTKFVKYLTREGNEVTVISPELHEGTAIDYSLETPELDKVKRITIPQSKVFRNVFLSKRNELLKKKSATAYIQKQKKSGLFSSLKTRVFRYIQFFYSLIRNYDWSRQVINFSQNNFGKNDFDCILTSYPSLGAPWASIELKKAGVSESLVCDFRDPINYENNTTKLILYINTVMQKYIINKSNFVTYVSNGVGDMIGRELSTDKFYLLTNGFDPDDSIEVIDNTLNKDSEKKLTFCYVGSLYGGVRDFTPFFQSISNLLNSSHIDIENINVVYAGKEYEVLAEQASTYNLERIILDKGFVSRKESLELQNASDICLVSSWNTEKDKGIMTGKVFEYFTYRKPIIAIVNGTCPGSELAQVINTVNAGCCLESSSESYKLDVINLERFILKAYKEKIDNGRIAEQYSDIVDNYSLEKVTNKLISIIKN